MANASYIQFDDDNVVKGSSSADKMFAFNIQFPSRNLYRPIDTLPLAVVAVRLSK